MAVTIAIVWMRGVALSTSGRNDAAQVLVDQSVALGLNFRSPHSADPHASAEDRSAFARVGFGAWLDAQIQVPDDSIGEPPAAVRDFLRDRHDALWRVVGALENGVPEWPAPEPANFPRQELVPMISLAEILFCEALVQEREGNRIDAGRPLEASWSLLKAMGTPPSLIGQLSAIAVERWQAGVLRKMKKPPIQWIDRLSSDIPWRRMFNIIEQEFPASTETDTSSDAFARALRRVYRATADRLRKQSPCEVSRLTDVEIWRSVASDVEQDTDARVRADTDFIADLLPTFTSAIRRTARVAVERELTGRILELRQDAAASPDRAWPPKLDDPTSHVCPDATYAYASDGRKMEIRFEGSIRAPENYKILPLSFRGAGAPDPASAPTPPPALTPATSGGMIPLQ